MSRRNNVAAPLVLLAAAVAVCFVGGALAAKPPSSASSKHESQQNTVASFKYPKGLPDPPMMWVEGFASRLHAKDVQKFETPIQVSSRSIRY